MGSSIPFLTIIGSVLFKLCQKRGYDCCKSDKGELISSWRMYIDYRKLNKSTHKDHFPLPFIDQMLERQQTTLFPIIWMVILFFFKYLFTRMIEKRLPLHAPMAPLHIERMSFDLCNAAVTFQRCIMAIFFWFCWVLHEGFYVWLLGLWWHFWGLVIKSRKGVA